MMPVIEFQVDGLRRTGVERAGPGPITRVALCACGQGSNGARFVTNSWGAVGPGWAVVALDPLPTDVGRTSWVVPGLPLKDDYYPESAPNDRTDLNFLDRGVAHAHEKWPDAEIDFVGNSKGASLGWASLAFGTEGIRAYFLALFGVPLETFYGWDFLEELEPGPFPSRVKPTALWHGGPKDDKSVRVGGAADYPTTAEALRVMAGATGYGPWRDLGPLDGLPLRMRAAIGGAVPVREYERVDGTHVWSPGEAAQARAWFASLGAP